MLWSISSKTSVPSIFQHAINFSTCTWIWRKCEWFTKYCGNLKTDHCTMNLWQPCNIVCNQWCKIGLHTCITVVDINGKIFHHQQFSKGNMGISTIFAHSVSEKMMGITAFYSHKQFSISVVNQLFECVG